MRRIAGSFYRSRQVLALACAAGHTGSLNRRAHRRHIRTMACRITQAWGEGAADNTNLIGNQILRFAKSRGCIRKLHQSRFQ